MSSFVCHRTQVACHLKNVTLAVQHRLLVQVEIGTFQPGDLLASHTMLTSEIAGELRGIAHRHEYIARLNIDRDV